MRDRLFLSLCIGLGSVYGLLVLAMLLADVSFTSPAAIARALAAPEIRYAALLSLTTATVSAVLSLWVATPIGYLMSRQNRGASASRWKRLAFSLLDTLFDIPLVLPPIVVGLSLLILFKFPPFQAIDAWVVYEIPAVVLAQFVVAAAFATRIMRATFDQISPRQEEVAMTLGADRTAAFYTVLLPQVRRGILAAAVMSWSRALGEFGPVLIFASSTRMRTEVLPTSVFLELQSGNLEGALAVSLLMIMLAALVLVVLRLLGGGTHLHYD